MSPDSLGPWGYLVVRGDTAVLVDVPYHSNELEAAIRQHAPGGVSHLLLTHDDFVSRIVVGFSAFGPWVSLPIC